MLRVGLPLLLTLSLGLRVAQAQPAPTSFSLEYSALDHCPTRAEFVREITRRTPSASEAPESAAEFRFRVHLQPGADGSSSGYLVVEPASAPASRRDVAAAPCEEVVESMAVIIALILAAGSGDGPQNKDPQPSDGDARVGPDSATRGAVVPVPPALAYPSPSARTPLRPAAEHSAEARQLDRSSVPAQGGNDADSGRRGGHQPPGSVSLRPGAVLGAIFHDGAAPDAAWGSLAGADLWLDREGVFAPTLRAAFLYVQSPTSATASGTARFRLLAARVDGCPWRFPASGRIAVRPCILLEAGQLSAEAGRAPGRPRSASMPWYGAGGVARGELRVLEPLWLEAQAALVVLGRADLFTFQAESEMVEPELETVHDVPRTTLSLGLNLVLRWP